MWVEVKGALAMHFQIAAIAALACVSVIMDPVERIASTTASKVS